MNDQHDGNADEAAARAIQAEIWMAEQEDVDAHPEDFMPENDRRLLLERRNELGPELGEDDAQQDNAVGEDDAGDAGDADNLNPEAEAEAETIDGGVAGEVFDDQKVKITRSLKCPLVLYFECDENLEELSPENPLLKRGVTVYIGLDKNTKLNNVFNRYCEFINSKAPSRNHFCTRVKSSDFEFVHCTILDPSHTVEASAMMKADRIKVRRERSKERSTKTEVIRLQRESDRKYFKDLRQLLPNLSPELCDVILDCQGKVVDERGYSQNVLATTVRANSVLVSKRCKWLGLKILHAREDLRRQDEIARAEQKNDEQGKLAGQHHGTYVAVGNESPSLCAKSIQSDDEDDVVPSFPLLANDYGGGNHPRAAEVEDDEDDDDIPAKGHRGGGHSTSQSSSSNSSSLVRVSLDHTPEAVKLLLEYCYTNRVLSVGQEAFIKASRYEDPKDVGTLSAKESGPVTPYRKHDWPNGGLPTLSLHVALAGIALAEESHMPRLSLMCEIAASLLVDHKNVIDVLSACQLQQQKTGNRLPLLRKAAMLDCVMANGSIGIDKLYSNPMFKDNLEERCSLVIPSLLEGTVEVLPTNMKTKEWQKKKDKMNSETVMMFTQIDKSDEAQRAIERNRWRLKGTVNRRVEIAFGPDEISQKMPSSTIANTTFSRNAKRKVRFGTDAERNRNSTRRNVRRKTRKDASAS